MITTASTSSPPSIPMMRLLKHHGSKGRLEGLCSVCGCHQRRLGVLEMGARSFVSLIWRLSKNKRHNSPIVPMGDGGIVMVRGCRDEPQRQCLTRPSGQRLLRDSCQDGDRDLSEDI